MSFMTLFAAALVATWTRFVLETGVVESFGAGLVVLVVLAVLEYQPPSERLGVRP